MADRASGASVIEGPRSDVVTLGTGYESTPAAQGGSSRRTGIRDCRTTVRPITDDRFSGAQRQSEIFMILGRFGRPGISVVTPIRKTSGGLALNYLASWAWALKQARRHRLPCR